MRCRFTFLCKLGFRPKFRLKPSLKLGLSGNNKKASIRWQGSAPPRASNGGRSLCVQISRERSYPLPILIPLERQLIALQLCCWQILYDETLHAADFSSFIVEIVRKTTNLGIW